MGWAPLVLFTGLFLSIFSIDLFAWTSSSYPLLLDEAPLSGDWILWQLLQFTRRQVSATFAILFQTGGWRSQHRTTSRSQVRAKGHRHSLFGSLALRFVLVFLALYMIDSKRGEGSVIGMDDRRAEAVVPAKQHVVEPRKVFEPNQTQSTKKYNRNAVQKRSYRRALQRISRHGYTWYRGQLISGVQQSPTSPVPLPNHAVVNHAPPSSHLRRRLSLFSWNCGGLTQAAWDHFQQWLTLQELDIVLIQETHWQFSSEWTQSHYYCMHSGISSRQAGLLTMISKRIVQQHGISWNETVKGRVLHVRIHGTSKGCDVINVYQHVHHVQQLEARAEVWHSLHDLLASIPKRNTLLLAGDMNTSLHKRCSAVGLATFEHNALRKWGPVHRDSDHLHNLLQVYDLTALNTWKHSLGSTYSFGTQASRIDYICAKKILTDQQARDVHYLHEFPLLNLTGAQHVPLLCNVLKVWTPMPNVHQPGWSRADRKALYLHWMKQDDHARTLHAKVDTDLQNLPQIHGDRLQEVHKCLNQFGPERIISSNKHDMYMFDVTPFQQFQHHTFCLRQVGRQSKVQLSQLFEAWTHVIKRQSARKRMNLTAKAARKHRLQQIFDHAADAARAQDSFQFFQAIRELAPKQPYRRIQLRSGAGALLGPSDAADSLRDWYQELYSANDDHHDIQHFVWPFSSDELALALKRLPAFKALDPAFAPAPIWQAAATGVAAYLQPYLEHCSSFDRLPECWGSGTLTFLCKPGKPGRAPCELRPIALLEPSGKAIMGMVATRLLQSVSSRLLRLPQMAYLPLRGSDEAICRVRKHCEDVRSLLDSLKYTIHRAASANPGPDVAGGFFLSLDLTKAFDSVLRSKLFVALESSQADADLIAMLKQIYASTNFSFWHRGQFRTLPTFRGIRQGCKAAPILWACFAAWILETTSEKNGMDWLREVLTAYADDFCLHSIFRSSTEFHLMITKVGNFLDLLIDAGLSINRDKTIALLKMTGPCKTRIHKRYLKRTKEGMFICIPSRHGSSFLIRLVTQVPYLGVVLSYSNFELLTMKHRLQAGVKVSHQLQRWIFKTAGLQLSHKVKLWFQCIFPCLIYGLRPIGVTSQTVELLDRLFFQQLRRICRSPVHLTHLTHADFLEHFGIADPLLSFLHQCRTAQRRELERKSILQVDDIVHHCPEINYAHLEQVLLQAYASRRESSTIHQAEFATFGCDQCDLFFTTMAQLRRHSTLEHGFRTGLLRTYAACDTHHGLPTCPHCKAMFTSWNRLIYHIQYVCHHVSQETEDLEHRLRVREYLHFVQGMCFIALCQRQDLTTYFTQRCILCGKFHSTPRGLLRHWSDVHNEVFRTHGDWNSYLLKQVSTSNPCEFCGTHFQREHNCVVIRQYAMYMTAHGQAAPDDSTGPSTAFPCQTCDKVFLTKHGLEQHLRNFHSAIQVGDQLTAAQFEAHCIVMQAVETDACMDLLGHPHIAELLSHVCLACQKPFQRKNELVRHLKSHHASLWNRTVRDAATIEAHLKGPHDCFCIPKVFNRKHQCMLTLQFALLRLLAHQSPDADAARTVPPDQLLAPSEVVNQLAWLGLLRLLILQPALRMTLSLHCQLCGSNFTSPTQLMGHFRAIHESAIDEASAWIRILTWVLFSAHGCLCNPAVNHGTPLHHCPLIYNLALMLQDGGPDIYVPWSYRATDLMDILEPLVSEPVLSKVSMLMLSRRFVDVMQSTEVYQLLTQRCLLCDAQVPLSCARTHIRVAHDFDLRNLEAIIQQLAAHAAQTHFDQWCAFCGRLLPYDLNDEDFAPRPEQHLLECDYIALVAMLISYPVWYKKPFIPDEWPTIEEVESSHHEVHLQLMQFNVQPSEPLDVIGQSFETLAACGFFMMSDPKFLEDFNINV